MRISLLAALVTLHVVLQPGAARSAATEGVESLTEGGWLAGVGGDRFIFVFSETAEDTQGGSQFILVVPQLDLVVVTTGGNQDNGMHMTPHQVVALPLLRGLGAL